MIRRRREESRATHSHLSIPAPKGLEYLPFQRAGIEFAAARERTLVSDEMGLGKSIEAIGLINYRDYRRVLVICPATLKINWCREIKKWSAFGLEPTYVVGRKDSLRSTVVCINYELLKDYAEAIRETTWDLVIVDEAHYLKSSKADRTAQVFGRKRAKPGKPRLSPIPYKNLLLLTGTPLLNKPKELWPLLQALDPEGIGADWFHFARRYCQLFEIKRFDASKGVEVHQGWKWDGAENMEELGAIMRERFMIRRLKKDVLTELPPKVRQVIVLEGKKGLDKLLKREIIEYEKFAATHAPFDFESPAFTEISKVRLETAVAKIPFVIDYLEEALSETEKIVIFAHHHEVIDAIAEAFPGSVRVDGRVSVEGRQEAVDRFQRDANCRLFIGGIHAAGVGLTLTAASLVVFAELDWVPGIITQAEDRLHRHGQKDAVVVRHIVLAGSLDERIAQVIIEKQEVADKALDR